MLAGDSTPAVTGADLLGISFAFGLIIAALVYALGKVSGCHINPAVTFALAATKRFPWREVRPTGPPRSSAPSSARSASGPCSPRARSTSAWGRRRSTRTRRTWGSAIFAEGIGTFMLMFAILGIVDSRSPGDFAGLVIGGVVVAIIMVVGPITGASLNPARAFGPELVSAIGGGATHWNQLIPVYVLPGLVGAGAGRVRLRLPRRRRARSRAPIKEAVTAPRPGAAPRRAAK